MVSLSGEPLRAPEHLAIMAVSLRHRGPDGYGDFVTQYAAIGAHRLRIVDRRPEADQPFSDGRGRVLVANGEIYNSPEIRRRFSAYPFRSECDVECLLPLAGDDVHGFERVAGMFACALWHERTQTLTLARDRGGEKPLFYMVYDQEVWFASEVQTLMTHPRFDATLDALAIEEYLTFGFVREPRTMHQAIRKVPAGTSVQFTRNRPPHAHPYSSWSEPATNGERDTDALLATLSQAVSRQIVADVPVGVFLSGGIDSSLIAQLATEASSNRVRTYSIGVPEPTYDESRFAKQVAEFLGTEHVQIDGSSVRLQHALQRFVDGCAEPLADPAVMPTLVMADAAREQVGVVLSGEGADELFGGYPTYLGHGLASRLGAVPRPMRVAARAVTRRARASHGSVAVGGLVDQFAQHADLPWLPRHLQWFGTGMYQHLSPEARERVFDTFPASDGSEPVAQAMRFDELTYLRDGLLVKLDRACMLVSLEARAPFLDPSVVAVAHGLPLSRKVNAFRTKRVLREIAKQRLPRSVASRRKHGLSVPIASWLNGALSPEVDRLLAPDRIKREGVLPNLPIEHLVKEHRRGRANHARPLWALVMFQYWLERWGPGAI